MLHLSDNLAEALSPPHSGESFIHKERNEAFHRIAWSWSFTT